MEVDDAPVAAARGTKRHGEGGGASREQDAPVELLVG